MVLKKLWRYLRLYFLITSQYIKARLSYRADFFISSLGIILANLPALLGLAIVLGNIPVLAGFSFYELVFIYGFALVAVSPLQIIFDHIWSLRYELQSGAFIKYYFKPLNIMFYYMSEMVDLKGLAQLLLGGSLLFWAGANLSLQWDILKIGALLFLLASASLIMIGLMLAAASTAFWIVNSFAVMALINRFREYARYPLTIFDGVFRFIFSFIIPIGFISFYPVQWLIHSNEAGWLVFLTPFVGVGFFLLGCGVWSLGVRRWNATGT